MPVVIPDCTSCKHLLDKMDNGTFYCSAFPDGIPKEYFWGKVDVQKLPECANKIKFEKAE